MLKRKSYLGVFFFPFSLHFSFLPISTEPFLGCLLTSLLVFLFVCLFCFVFVRKPIGG